MGKFVSQARLADAGFPHDRRHLPVTVHCKLLRAVELLELGFAADEWGEAPPDGRLQPCWQRTCGGVLLDFEDSRHASDGYYGGHTALDSHVHRGQDVAAG